MSVIEDRLATLDQVFLEAGGHEPDSRYCVMEYVAYVAGEPWSARPQCVSPIIGSFLRSWNDSLNDDDRQMLKPLVEVVIGTRTSATDESARAWMVTDWLARECAPAWLRLAGLTAHAETLEQLAPLTSTAAARKAQPALDQARHAGAAAGDAARAAAWHAARAAAGDAARGCCAGCCGGCSRPNRQGAPGVSYRARRATLRSWPRVSGEPFSKDTQLARGERRHYRKVATKAEWAEIVAEKQGPCRVCVNVKTNGHDYGVIEFHHLVSRAQGGDDVPDNIVPVHSVCHRAVTANHPLTLAALAASLTDSERAYVASKRRPGR